MHATEPGQTVARQLRRSQAHTGLSSALDGIPFELAGRQAPGHPHTAWQQVEHMRLTAEDLVAYCQDSGYQAPGWPEGYWPEGPAPSSAAAWSASCRRLLEVTEQMARLVEAPDRDLYATVPAAEAPGHHTLRAGLVLLDHNGYHAAQLIAWRRALGIWSTR